MGALAAGVGGVEVALDDEGEAAAHDTVAVLPVNNKGNVSTGARCA